MDGRTARRADTRGTILNAATKLFVAKGMSATSVDDIAEAAKVAKGSIYYNFSSKDALVEALMTRHLDQARVTLAAAAEGLVGVERQRAILGALLRGVQDNPDTARIMVSETFRTDRPWRDAAQAWRDVTMELLIDDLIATRGAEKADECALTAAAMVGATLTTAMEWLAFRPELPFDVVKARIFDALHLG